MAHIVLENATKIYGNGKITAVENLSIECRDKEFLAILGPSGAGKTSTLKMIAGVEALTGGKLFIDGTDMTDLPPQKRNTSMVFESYALYPHFTVRENLAFPLMAPARKKKLSRTEIDKIVEHWAGIVEMGELLDRKPSQLSGGQRQRVSLARALVRSPEPNVILMDEPIAHLDAKLRNNMRTELKRLHKDLGATIIYVTHDYVEAMGMADRIAVIEGGHLMQIGTPREIYEDPVNEFVASTVGEPPMNLLRGEVVQIGDRTVFQFKESMSLDLNGTYSYVGPANLGIRPPEIHVSREQPERNFLKGRVERVLPTECKQIMEINSAGVMVLAKMRRDHSYKRGDIVFLTPTASGKVYLFDLHNKNRLDGREGGEGNG